MLITEKYPLNAHAHGISVFLPFDKYFIPAGKGIPKKKPVMPIKAIEINIFTMSDAAIVFDKILDRENVWNRSKNAITIGIIKSIFLVIHIEAE